MYQKAYKLDSALESYQNAIELDPSLLEAYMKRGNIYLKWRSYYAALKSFESILRFQTNYPEINYLIGSCLEKLGNKEKALEFYTLETQHDPDNHLAIAGAYRVQSQIQRVSQFNPGIYKTKPAQTVPQTRAPVLDTTRIRINTIQPRSTILMNTDTIRRKIIIK
jgi:tetratricopeptide (TPR) repeat protein